MYREETFYWHYVTPDGLEFVSKFVFGVDDETLEIKLPKGGVIFLDREDLETLEKFVRDALDNVMSKDDDA